MAGSWKFFVLYSVLNFLWLITVSQNSSEQTKDYNVTLRMATYCITPNKDSGYCVPISNCTKLQKQLNNNKATQFLNASRCGPKNEEQSNFLVCCGKHANYKELDKSPLPKSCGHQNVTIRGRILGGVKAVIGEFPWLARLIHRDKAGSKTFGCTGFLVASKFVVTAAHCLQSENNKFLGPIDEIQLGEHNTETEIDCDSKNETCADKIQIIKIQDLIAHPSYDHNSSHHHHDIGLIYLKKGAKITSFVSPICLSEKPFDVFEYWLSGWGTTENGAESPIKLKVSVPPYAHQACVKKYKKFNIRVTDKQLCAGGKKNKDSCTGDSGGPLMYVDKNKWYASGVVSYGVSCGTEDWPAIYTNITNYYDWIKKTMTKKIKEDKLKTVTPKN